MAFAEASESCVMVALEKSNSGPRELFSVSQIEKAFGPGYEQGMGCLRAWGERYLEGWREPELTYHEALALPDGTPAEKKIRSSYIAKTFGKALEAEADKYLAGEPVNFESEPGRRLFPGLHLLPHPRQIARLELQAAISIKTNVLSLTEPGRYGDDTISWQGFKDLRFTLHTAPDYWYLFDYKTTKPKVDNRKNAQLGKPQGSWTWQKTPEQLRRDWQWNLYQWDEHVNYGQLAPSRWVYWASADKPEARASDIFDPYAGAGLEGVRNVVLDLDNKARKLRTYIRQFKAGELQTEQLPQNRANCSAFGGCPYSTRHNGRCNGEDGFVPVGALFSAPGFVPVAFETQIQATEGNYNMSIMDNIKAQAAANAAQANAQQPGFPGTGAPGYPQSAGAHLGSPKGYTPSDPPAGGFQPQQGQPGFNPAAAPAPAPAPYVPPQQTVTQAPPAPVQQWQPPPQVQQGPPAFGTPSEAPGWYHDGRGTYIDEASLRNIMAQQAQQAAQAPQVSHVSPPEAGHPPANQTPVVAPPQATAPVPQAEAPKKRGRPAKAQTGAPAPSPTANAPVEAPADVSEAYPVTATVTLPNGCEVSAPISGELALALCAYVLETAYNAS